MSGMNESIGMMDASSSRCEILSLYKVQMQFYDYFLEKRCNSSTEKSISRVSYLGSGFLFLKQVRIEEAIKDLLKRYEKKRKKLDFISAK